ncbi:hypothetical protein BJ508DRAFT_114469 [Ascobolus immersus RN42]|uniref:Uncharacterized protein n=1 Tax=Ascobolus immersus RN42 TaxID=1160509 RepID=A0A3N4I5M6_ASCIM|nr:hypothetical protein BJ508DRAFT_114469 [Ascobolus immersus RN42]
MDLSAFMDSEEELKHKKRQRYKEKVLKPHLPSPPNEELWTTFIEDDIKRLAERKSIPPLRSVLWMLYDSNYSKPDVAQFYLPLYEPLQRYLSLVLRFYDARIEGEDEPETVHSQLTRLDRMCSCFENRRRAGLLRVGQVQLVIVLLQNSAVELECLFETRPTEVALAMHIDALIMARLLCSEKFRSERLELLLWKHLNEEGVDMNVVRFITAKARASLHRFNTMGYYPAYKNYYKVETP